MAHPKPVNPGVGVLPSSPVSILVHVLLEPEDIGAVPRGVFGDFVSVAWGMVLVIRVAGGFTWWEKVLE